jgi:hypothetical protein
MSQGGVAASSWASDAGQTAVEPVSRRVLETGRTVEVEGISGLHLPSYSQLTSPSLRFMNLGTDADVHDDASVNT